jgi:hypothetical protein
MQRKHMYIKIFFLTTLLAACGGGGGGEEVKNLGPIGYFTKVDQAFDDPSFLYNFAFKNDEINDQGSNYLAVDLDDDGADEILIITNKQPKDNAERSKSKIYVFKWNAIQSKFLDVTNSYIEDTSLVNGNLAWMTAKKYNKETIILISDNEDRPPLWTGKLRILSKGNYSKYKLTEVGRNGVADYPGSFVDSLGQFNVYAAGDPGESYIYKNNNFTISSKIMPRLSVGGAHIYSRSETKKIDTIIQAGAADGSQIEAWSLNSNDEWVNIGLTTPFEKIATERWLDRYGGLGSIDVYRYNNKSVLGPGSGSIISMACATNKTITKEVEVFFHVPLNYISNYVPGQLLDWGSTRDISSIIARGRIVNNKLIIDYPKITGEIGTVNHRTFACIDVNKDGLDDLVVNYLNTWINDKPIQEIKPLIYLNKGDGTFEVAKFNYVSHEIKKTSHYNQASTEVGDFDGDGILDFIIFGGPGIDEPRLDTVMQFYKGIRKIE